MKKAKHFLSFLLTLALVLTALPMTALPAGAAASEDFTYSVISETNKTCSITKYIGTATELEIPSVLDGYTVTEIGFNAFYECTALTSVTIPDSVTSIGDSAFSGCTSLSSIAIPDSVTSIGTGVFDNTAYYNDEINWENDVLYIGSHLIKVKTTLSGEYTVKADTKTIVAKAFESCTSLTNITIPDSVIGIGGSAFYNCSLLTTVNIGKSVMSISDSAFSGCTSLSNITIPDSVIDIGTHAFSACTSLTNITIGNGVKSIGSRAFDSTSLISVTIPESVTSIGDFAFFECKALASIEVAADNPTYTSENGILFNKSKTVLLRYPEGKSEVSYSVPNSVTSIGSGAFYGCTSLTNITIPDSVTNIGYGAFFNCFSLTSVAIPGSVTSIGDMAFYYCITFTNIAIPNGVERIGDAAFWGCVGLRNITIPDSVTSIGIMAFYGCSTLKSITIPDSVKSIGDYAFSESGLQTICGYSNSYAETYANENRYTFVPLKTLGDAETNIVLVLPSDSISSENTVLNVEKCAVEETAVTYDITLTVDGEITQPTSAATVKMPVSAETGGAQYKVYRQEANGGYTDMCATYQNGYMVFTTDHFSTYVLLNTTLCTQGDMNGDTSMTISDYAVMADIAIGKQTPTAQNIYCGDLNKDSVVDFFDVSLLDLILSGNYTLEEITN